MKTVRGIHLSDKDTCVTLTGAADADDIISFTENGAERNVTAKGPVPVWHKIAVSPVMSGGEVYKYGAVIGVATISIEPGEHVHTHNIRSPEAED